MIDAISSDLPVPPNTNHDGDDCINTAILVPEKKSTKNSHGFERCAITHSESLDAIDEAWESRNPGGFCLNGIQFDCSTVRALLRKWIEEQRVCVRSASLLEPVHRLELHRCSFEEESAVDLFATFLQELGPSLKEIFLVDIPAQADDFSPQGLKVVSLLQGLDKLPGLERLAIDNADLTGAKIGSMFEKFLTNSPNLREIRLNDCNIDRGMFDPFLQGLKSLNGLEHLDLDGLYLSDRQLKKLVQTLLHSRARETLKCLDLSRSDITKKSFGVLAHLIRKMVAIDELVLNDCAFLGVNCASNDPEFLRFLWALKENASLKELRMDECQLTDPLDAAITRASGKIQGLTLESSSGEDAGLSLISSTVALGSIILEDYETQMTQLLKDVFLIEFTEWLVWGMWNFSVLWRH